MFDDILNMPLEQRKEIQENEKTKKNHPRTGQRDRKADG